jgi:hypothetical protein
MCVVKLFELPSSWVAAVLITSDMLAERWPNRTHTTLYQQTRVVRERRSVCCLVWSDGCVQEEFAPRSRLDGLVKRITHFADKDNQIVTEVIECYSERLCVPSVSICFLLLFRSHGFDPLVTSCSVAIVLLTRTRASGSRSAGAYIPSPPHQQCRI